VRHQKIELLAFVINSDEYPLSIASAANRGAKKEKGRCRGEREREMGRKDVRGGS